VTVAVHHRLDGPRDAPVLVLSGSLGSSLEMWDEVCPALAGRFRVVRYDHRGHGRSPVPSGPYSIADLGEDVLALLDMLAAERASFCGISLGGMIGIWLGAHAADRLERLAICCIQPRLVPSAQWRERAATVRAQGVGAVAEAALERWFTPAFHRDRAATVRRFHRMLLACPAEGYAGGCEAIAGADLRSDLDSIRAPTLVLGGDDDPVAPPRRLRALAEAIGGSRLALVPGARHLPCVEHPELFSRELLAHLDAEVRV
jgi:3-oxoadipate enol-lactonase